MNRSFQTTSKYKPVQSKSYSNIRNQPDKSSSNQASKQSLQASSTTRRGLIPIKGSTSLDVRTPQQFKYQSNLLIPKAGHSGMGHHYVMMSKLKESRQREQIPFSSYLSQQKQYENNEKASIEIDEIIRKVRENSLEMRRHENTLALAHANKGRSMSRQETMLLEKNDRSRLATNF